MDSYTIADSAARDLAEVWNYLAEQSGSEEIADHFIDALLASFDTLAAMPEMGQTRSYLPPEVLAFPHDSYIIFYVKTTEGVAIVQVLHGGRDLLSFFET